MREDMKLADVGEEDAESGLDGGRWFSLVTPEGNSRKEKKKIVHHNTLLAQKYVPVAYVYTII